MRKKSLVCDPLCDPSLIYPNLQNRILNPRLPYFTMSNTEEPNVEERKNDGVARIKPEYIVTNHIRLLAAECVAEEDKGKIDETNILETKATGEKTGASDEVDQPPKFQRLSKAEKKKLRGQNKARPPPIKFEFKKCLCPYLVDVREDQDLPACPNKNCRFLHSISDFMSNRPPDIFSECHIFKLRGHCPRGPTCRFGSSHITPEGRNKVNKDVYEKFMSGPLDTYNTLTKQLQTDLRKRNYDFSRSEEILKRVDNRAASDKTAEGKGVKRNNEGQVIQEANDDNPKAESGSDTAQTNGEESVTAKEEKKNFGPITDEDIIKIRSSEKKKINWEGKLSMTPLTTVGNLPFRRICKEFGVDVTCGEMAMAPSILQGFTQEWALVKRHRSEDIFGVQLCGTNPYVMTKAAQVLEEQAEVDFIDVNIGCPIDLVYQEGGGCGLMRRPRVLQSIIQSMSQTLTLPLTVKIRTGITAGKNLAHNFMPGFRDWGASLITVHGRSREQRYTRSANWEYIDECARLASPIPVFGNGDILSFEDYQHVMDTYKNISGAMIGRGALIKPWVFTEIKEHRMWDISSSERLDILRKYVKYGLEHWGSDNKGVENTRRFLLEWLSFLHRYIPVGLLEKPPQKINERPPVFHGRDDLETLMASPNCAHWIQISEMLLGPVPEGFSFLPKHKANSWK